MATLEKTEETLEFLRAENVQLRADSLTTRIVKANPAGAAMVALGLLIPIGGWVGSVSNRVAVIEAQANNLRPEALEMSALKQEITDFRKQYDRDRIDDGVRNTRSGQGSRKP